MEEDRLNIFGLLSLLLGFISLFAYPLWIGPLSLFLGVVSLIRGESEVGLVFIGATLSILSCALYLGLGLGTLISF